jgi:hypothetical protein
VAKLGPPVIALITSARDQLASALGAGCLPGVPFQHFFLPQHGIAQAEGFPNSESGGKGGSKDRLDAAIGGGGQAMANLANPKRRPKVGDEGEYEVEDVRREVTEHDI